ncbi:hypothetical protein GCM10007890_61740 [Methylobacterium tardum]|uniref:Uncharacterized protein n=1 Tax=Methylobacterium tardum TaxID=374432 RepID=A0AA37THP4_9HYPH|nr:hypothetical protein GCM10007890_61740 [Methylobacterium tardum]
MDLEAVRALHQPEIGGREAPETALHEGMSEKTLAEAHVTPGAAGKPAPDRFRIEFDRAWSSSRAEAETTGLVHNQTFVTGPPGRPSRGSACSRRTAKTRHGPLFR